MQLVFITKKSKNYKKKIMTFWKTGRNNPHVDFKVKIFETEREMGYKE